MSDYASKSNVSKFLANFHGGGARPNRYFVSLYGPDPAGLNGKSFVATKGGDYDFTKLSFLCNATSLPASNIGKAPANYMGRVINVAGDRTFDDWNVTVYNDYPDQDSYSLRDMFEKWIDHLLGNATNITHGMLDPLKQFGDAQVEQLSREGKTLATYRVMNMFPTTISEISLGYDQNDTIETFQVSFAITHWETSRTEEVSGSD